VARWAQRLGASGFRIGICWQGSTQAVDAGRSFAVTHFEGLSQVPGVRLISLHRGAGEAQLAHLPPSMRVEQLGDELDRDGAFLDTAAVIMHCHLVITSDTAVAHLAGALGAPVWLALKHVPEWRWMLQREDSPWYPTMRLFRQHTRGDWPEVFQRSRRVKPPWNPRPHERAGRNRWCPSGACQAQDVPKAWRSAVDQVANSIVASAIRLKDE
jgi:hypothetical protein